MICRRCATVSVTVTDAGNHNPLPGATVKASGFLANQPFVLTARHLGDGVFTFAHRTRSGLREVCVPEGGTPPIGAGILSMTGASQSNFDSPHAFTISSGFVPGTNFLEVQVANFGVHDSSNRTAFNVTGLIARGIPLP